jgi:hypothetical protein
LQRIRERRESDALAIAYDILHGDDEAARMYVFPSREQADRVMSRAHEIVEWVLDATEARRQR